MMFLTQRKEFDIRYVKLHFTLQLTEDAVLPRYKASALRGGMGEMLLRANCIRDRKCELCDFEPECIVRRMMYSKMEIQPKFMTSGDSVGYVTECEDYHEEFSQGDTFRFNLILFGKSIVYFSQYLNALYALGMNGLGKEHGRFRIISITNTKGQEILRNDDILMKNYEVSRLQDYVDYRVANSQKNPPEGEILFKTPLALKYKGEMVRSFEPEAIFEGIKRRIYMLACFEGIESDIMNEVISEVPEVISEDHYDISIRRYSNHQESAMNLKGIEGRLVLENIPEEMRDILYAGELVHIGKNTSFGFGRYRLH